MAKFQLHHSLISVIITAFLAVQLTVDHVHLADHHDHDGSHHQHPGEAHGYHLIGDLTDTTEFPHITNGKNVVDVERNALERKYRDHSPVDELLTVYQWIDFTSPERADVERSEVAKYSQLERTPANSRAPPQDS